MHRKKSFTFIVITKRQGTINTDETYGVCAYAMDMVSKM